MARNKDLPSKMRRGKKSKQSQSIPNWVTLKTNRNLKSSPYTNRTWRNKKLKRD